MHATLRSIINIPSKYIYNSLPRVPPSSRHTLWSSRVAWYREALHLKKAWGMSYCCCSCCFYFYYSRSLTVHLPWSSTPLTVCNSMAFVFHTKSYWGFWSSALETCYMPYLATEGIFRFPRKWEILVCLFLWFFSNIFLMSFYYLNILINPEQSN